MMIRLPAKGIYKFQSKSCVPMCVKKAKSNLVFVVQDIIIACQLTVQARRIVPYPARNRQQRVLEEINKQAAHFDTTFHLVEDITGVWNQKEEYEVHIK